MNGSLFRRGAGPGPTPLTVHDEPGHSRDLPTGDAPPAVRLRGVGKSFGQVVAVRDVDLVLKQGTLTSLLGPSGCGKTTLLRLIAGLEAPTRGEIEINGRSVGQLPIHKRNIGLVFQSYALFPHKTVGDNIAFGLKHRGVDRATAAERVRRALSIVRLPGIEDRYPNQLSGGQQQRVALARAVVFEPDVLLLDEPLSALDANLREEMRIEIKLIQKALGLTTILVTHDQQEALSMSDEVVVMNQGMVQQTGDPRTVYSLPCNRFVASFLGQANVCAGTLAETVAGTPGQWVVKLENGISLRCVPGGPDRASRQHRVGDAVDVVIRAADLTVEPLVPGLDVARVNGFRGCIEDTSYLGDHAHYLIGANSITFKAIGRLAGDGAAVHPLVSGTDVLVSASPDVCAFLPTS